MPMLVYVAPRPTETAALPRLKPSNPNALSHIPFIVPARTMVPDAKNCPITENSRVGLSSKSTRIPRTTSTEGGMSFMWILSLLRAVRTFGVIWNWSVLSRISMASKGSSSSNIGTPSVAMNSEFARSVFKFFSSPAR